MPYTDQEILEKAKLLQQKGISNDKIKEFVTVAKKEQVPSDDRGMFLGAVGKLGEQISKVPSAASGVKQFGESLAVSPMGAGMELGKKVVGGLGKALGKTVLDIGKSAIDTAKAYPAAIKTAGAATGQLLRGGKMDEPFQPPTKFQTITPEETEQLQQAGTGAVKTTAKAAGFVPTPLSQFASGYGVEFIESIEQGKSPEEALGRAGVVGGERYALMKFIQKLSKQPQKIKEAKQKIVEQKTQPKLTIKEKRLATDEGRVIKGKDSKIFGKKPDVVKPAPADAKAAKTVADKIDDAYKLDEQALNQKIKGEITREARALQPDMQKTKITAETIRKARNKWDSLKTEQADDLLYQSAGIDKMQKKFETFLDQFKKVTRTKSGKFRTKSLDDIWNVAKGYDKSIPTRIKQATEMSDAILQAQKDTWLQNRSILRDMIKSTETGLGSQAKTSFDIMKDLYRASNNIVQKAPIDVKGTTGILSKETLLKGAAGTVGAAFGLNQLKQLLGGN